MYFLGALDLEAEYLDSSNFKLLLEKEINMRDKNNNAALMCLCRRNAHLLNNNIFNAMLKQ